MTLMECLVTIAIVAVLAAVAAPSLSDQLNAARAYAGAQQLYASLQYARGMAQTLATEVTVCPLAATASAVDPCGGHFGEQEIHDDGLVDEMQEPMIINQSQDPV